MSFQGSSVFILELAEAVACFEDFDAVCGVEAADDPVFEVERRGPLRPLLALLFFVFSMNSLRLSWLSCSDSLLDEIVTDSDLSSPAVFSGPGRDAAASATVRSWTSACNAACRRGVDLDSDCSSATVDFELATDPSSGDVVRAFFELGCFEREVDVLEVVDVNGNGFPRDADFVLARSASVVTTGVFSASKAP